MGCSLLQPSWERGQPVLGTTEKDSAWCLLQICWTRGKLANCSESSVSLEREFHKPPRWTGQADLAGQHLGDGHVRWTVGLGLKYRKEVREREC